MSETLAEAGFPVPEMPIGIVCAVHHHDEYVPMERHHIWPLGMGGPDVETNIVTVCANAHYMIHEFIRQLMLHGATTEIDGWRHYGTRVRALAVRGWVSAGSPRHGQSGE